ncbi:MAG: hypothetical protein WDM89_04050 [Rhizomicrobium sp.]
MARSELSALFVAACFVSSTAMAAQFTSFSVPGAKNTIAVAINASGVVTGSYSVHGDKQAGFFRTPDGTITTFAVPGFKSTDPAAINDAGWIVGYSGAEKSFVRKPDGSVETFQIDGAVYTTATAINAAGYVSGTFSNADHSSGSFLRAPDGTLTVVSVSNDEETSVYGLNDDNVLVGQIGFGESTHGFVLNNGKVTTLGTGTSVTAINNSGIAAGVTMAPNDNSRAFTVNAHGHVKPFGPKFSDIEVARVDQHGGVAGYYLDRHSRFHGFVFAGGQFVKIDEPDAGRRAPFAGTRVLDINAAGALTGFFASNRYRNTAFVWTP